MGRAARHAVRSRRESSQARTQLDGPGRAQHPRARPGAVRRPSSGGASRPGLPSIPTRLRRIQIELGRAPNSNLLVFVFQYWLDVEIHISWCQTPRDVPVVFPTYGRLLKNTLRESTSNAGTENGHKQASRNPPCPSISSNHARRSRLRASFGLGPSHQKIATRLSRSEEISAKPRPGSGLTGGRALRFWRWWESHSPTHPAHEPHRVSCESAPPALLRAQARSSSSVPSTARRRSGTSTSPEIVYGIDAPLILALARNRWCVNDLLNTSAAQETTRRLSDTNAIPLGYADCAREVWTTHARL